MKFTKDLLYSLLPAIYRTRDQELADLLKTGTPPPLESIINIIAEQVAVIEKNIDDLYNNWFIETCDPWVVPYIGDLIGVKELNKVTQNTINQRARIANTISFRRRKGTLVMLEELARDVTEWPTRAVEFFNILITTQYLNHLRPSNTITDVRKIRQLELLGTPFDTISHTVDVRNIASKRGYYNIPNIGLFFWRLQPIPIRNAPAFNPSGDNQRFTFNQLGMDMPLFNYPVTEASQTNVAEEINLPAKIRRSALSDDIISTSQDKMYYTNYEDDEKSITIKVDDDNLLKSDDVIVSDLSNWCKPQAGKVAIDPELGRIYFPTNDQKTVHVSYYYGLSGEMGGGGYGRLTTSDGFIVLISQDDPINSSIQKAFENWDQNANPKAIFEIKDSEVYSEKITLNLMKGSSLEIRASNNQRPVIQMKDILSITGDEQSNLTFDGLLFYGNNIEIGNGDMESVTFRHSTLVPQTISENGLQLPPTFLKLKEGNDKLAINADHAITGQITIENSEAVVNITDSIVDGNGDYAINCDSCNIVNSTIFGQVTVNLLQQASNTIFMDKVTVQQRQKGCVRFCYVTDDSQVPPRYECQPKYPKNCSDSEKKQIALKIRPCFTSVEYGKPGYAQLGRDIACEIFEGADNRSEMGVFNGLFQPQRIKNIQSSLDEYSRVGTEVGTFFIT